jgi:hypothetical protein
MSRGLGALQRRVCEVLLDAGDGGLPPRELRRGVGDPDRSNLRRVVRGFLAHGQDSSTHRHIEAVIGQ